MLLLVAHITACTADLADSGPVYPGWALEQTKSGAQPVDGEARAGIVATLDGVRCDGCTVEHEAELTVEIAADGSDMSASIRSASGAALVERTVADGQSALLVVPLFSACSTAPACTQGVELHVAGHGVATWSAHARSLSTHDAELWEPGATLTLR